MLRKNLIPWVFLRGEHTRLLSHRWDSFKSPPNHANLAGGPEGSGKLGRLVSAQLFKGSLEN